MESPPPRDLKIESRRFRVWSLYLEGLTQEEIAEREGVDRRTIYRDIQALKNRVMEQPQNVDTIYKETYDRILQSAEKVQQRAERAERDSDAAKLWKVVAEFDSIILERFTTNQTPDEIEQEKEDMLNQHKAMIDYIIQKLGPEGIGDFEEYWRQQRALDKWK